LGKQFHLNQFCLILLLKEVNEDEMDTSSAYILFYERLGLDRGRYMPDVSGKEPQSVDSDEEFEKDLKKLCIIQ